LKRKILPLFIFKKLKNPNLLKTVISRIYSFFMITPLIVFLSTEGDWSITLIIGFVELFVKILSYYVFERIYNALK